MANRHGLVTGATGTGKTVTLQLLADRFSSIGVPVFLADVKGDLSGVAAAGSLTPKLAERLKAIHADAPDWRANPAVFWDVFGRRGFPVRATVSDLGPLLLGRLLGLNATQEGVLAHGVQDCGRLGAAAAGSEGSAGHAAVCRRQRASVHDRVRQRVGRVDRCDSAGAAGDRAAGRQSVLRRADARHRRPAADRRQGPRDGQRPVRRRADSRAEALLDVPPLDAVGAVRAAAGGRRSRQADARILLRRSAPAVRRCAAGARRKDRAGRAPDSLQRASACTS